MELQPKFFPLRKNHGKYTQIQMDVSKNRGTPKWMVYNGKRYWNGWFGGKIPYFRKHPNEGLGWHSAFPYSSHVMSSQWWNSQHPWSFPLWACVLEKTLTKPCCCQRLHYMFFSLSIWMRSISTEWWSNLHFQTKGPVVARLFWSNTGLLSSLLGRLPKASTSQVHMMPGLAPW